MELLYDRTVEQQFQKLVTDFLARNKNYNMSNFIGGLPVTLERGDVARLMTKGGDNKSKYTVTQKVDGTRLLMYIGPDSKTANVKQRTVCFVGRNMKIYTIRNDARDILPYVNTREMLLDGEIVFFDSDGVAHKELESRKVKGVSFMAFDILFGPENIDTSSDEKIIGQEFSFVVPEDGKLKTHPWRYIDRYGILHKLIIPSDFNKFEPALTAAFSSKDWFNVELKPIYFLETLKDRPILYNESNTGYLQSLLSDNRRKFYEWLKKTYNKKTTVFTMKTLTLDGLIFTAADTLYTIGSWDKLLTTQYKWKPSNEQTVDLLIGNVKNERGELFVSKRGNIEHYQVNYNKVTAVVPPGIKNNTVAEFSLDNSGRFIFKEVRNDKTTPNALRTVLNVINSFKNPVNINDLYYFLNLSENSKKGEIRKVLEYSTKTKLLQCVANYKTMMSLLESKQLSLINDMIKNVGTNTEIEVEVRFGVLNRNFNPQIPKKSFLDILTKVESFGYKKTIDDFIDVYSDASRIRTRYIFSNEFGKYIFFESITKNRISNIDINMQNVINYDVRIAMSSEVKVKQYNTSGESYRKYRVSFTEPGGLFRLDFTAITSGEYSNRSFAINKDSNETFQIEIEFLKNDINVDNLFRFITQMLAT